MTCDERISKLKSFLTGTLQQAKQSLSSERERERTEEDRICHRRGRYKNAGLCDKKGKSVHISYTYTYGVSKYHAGNIRQSACCLKLLGN